MRDGQAGDETMGSMSKTLGALALASAALFAGDAAARNARPDPRQQDAAHRLRSRCTALLLHRSRQPGQCRSPGLFGRRSAAPSSTTSSKHLKVPDLKIVYVAVNSQNRFDALTGNKADLLCESSTATLSRRADRRFLDPDLHRRRQLRDPSRRSARRQAARRQEGRRAARHHDRAGAAPRTHRHEDQCRASCWSRPTRKASTWSKWAASRPISPTAPRSPSCCARRSRRPAC